MLCSCEIPQIIQAAHIWSVASIKRADNINQEDKLQFAIDGDNGIWLCNNHHKLFDVNLIFISEEGQVKYKSDIEVNHKSYLYDTTIKYGIEEEILTSNFLWYLEKRNNSLDERGYSLFE